MSGVRRKLTLAAGITLAFLIFGFVVFATSVTREPVHQNVEADGIVVLTGVVLTAGPTRIAEGARLLKEGRGKRLLISGVNTQTGRDSMRKLTKLEPSKFDCCVDLGYAALDTIGNASETRNWAREKGYTRIIVVTSSYHMPRSLMELAQAMPGVTLLPHAVGAAQPPDRPWWLEGGLTRALAREYLKFLAASAKLMASRGLAWLHG